MLYLVSTPIGNLKDMTLRAIDVLKEVDLIVCEDTRKSSILLRHHEIITKTISYHAHSDQRKIMLLIDKLKEGQNLAVISDAGNPSISDPIFPLILKVKEEKIPYTIIPGASAFLSALSLSGYSLREFKYLGFIPHKKGRMTFINSIKNEKSVVVFYESCHRIKKCVKEIFESGLNREICIAREITKMHEEVIFLSETNYQTFLTEHKERGEYVVVVKEQ